MALNDHIQSIIGTNCKGCKNTSKQCTCKLKTKDLSLLEYISKLSNNSFEGWSEDSINGYLTALESIKNYYLFNS